jgi:hypothetical protein
MGCYDIVKIPCPACGHVLGFQSKGGDCSMSSYTLETAPADVLSDVNRHAPATCRCGALVSVEIERKARAVTK